MGGGHPEGSDAIRPGGAKEFRLFYSDLDIEGKSTVAVIRTNENLFFAGCEESDGVQRKRAALRWTEKNRRAGPDLNSLSRNSRSR